VTGKVAFRGWDGKFVVSGGRGKPVAGKIPAPPPHYKYHLAHVSVVCCPDIEVNDSFFARLFDGTLLCHRFALSWHNLGEQHPQKYLGKSISPHGMNTPSSH